VLLLDDAHHLSGRKLDIAQRLALVAGRIVSGASQESRIFAALLWDWATWCTGSATP
jgi:hypothetical protein